MNELFSVFWTIFEKIRMFADTREHIAELKSRLQFLEGVEKNDSLLMAPKFQSKQEILGESWTERITVDKSTDQSLCLRIAFGDEEISCCHVLSLDAKLIMNLSVKLSIFYA